MSKIFENKECSTLKLQKNNNFNKFAFESQAIAIANQDEKTTSEKLKKAYSDYQTRDKEITSSMMTKGCSFGGKNK